MKTPAIYGNPPKNLGLIDLNPEEMMFWLYCPIKMAGDAALFVPQNLRQYSAIIAAVRADLHRLDERKWLDSYVYITAKTLYVTPGNPGNRPGWHSDGFLTDDLNYVWSDKNPTVFWMPEYDFVETRVSFTADHNASLAEMDAMCEPDVTHHFRYPNKHLLRLDQTVMHKVDTDIQPGVRTFVKISVSKHRYALKGNSINHELHYGWSMEDRTEERNDPAGMK